MVDVAGGAVVAADVSVVGVVTAEVVDVDVDVDTAVAMLVASVSNDVLADPSESLQAARLTSAATIKTVIPHADFMPAPPFWWR
jgi:hypothetical protein